MYRGRGSVGVSVFPPYLSGVALVDHHCVGSVTGTPRVAAHSCVRVHVWPTLLRRPLLLPFVPTVLKECGVVCWEPEMHAVRVRTEGNGVVFAVDAGEFAHIGIAIVVTIPTCLESNVWCVVSFEIKVIKWARLPYISDICVSLLADLVVCINVEEMPL